MRNDPYTTAGTTSLTDWLAARFAEDEAVAQAASGPLAEVAAKRAIMGLHHKYLDICTQCIQVGGEHDRESWPCLTLRALALPYADADGFREEWAL